MSARKTKGFAVRLGSLFGKKKAERHVTPHIYVSTESDAKKRSARAKRRAAKEKAERSASAPTAGETVGMHEAPGIEEAADVGEVIDEKVVEASDDAAPRVTKADGKLRRASKEEGRAPSALDEAATLEDEEGFMQKVHLRRADKAPRKGLSLWTMVRDRFGIDAPKRRAPSTEKADPVDLTNDSFLRHATAAKVDEPIVRSEASDEPGPRTNERREESSGSSALDEAASGDAPAMPRSRDEKKSEVAKALEDNADIVEASKPEEKAPVAEKPAPVRKKLHAPQFQSKKGLKAFLTSLNYIGMGKERMMFIQNMATMLNAGLPLTDALKTLVLETRNRAMRKLIQRIVDAVENGSPLWRAMEAQNFFSLHALALVRIGEEAGNLSENMGYLAEQDEKDHALRSKVKMAMIYPTIVMCIMFVIVVGLGMFVLPNLVGVLFSLNVKLPLITRIVIWFSDAFTEYGAVAVPGSIGVFIVIGILSKYTSLRIVTQWVMFRIPGIGRLAREATIARFGVILGGLLKAGVPVVEALQSLEQVTPIASYKRLYGHMLARVTIGDSFAKCFATIKGSNKLLPASVQQLVITGEKSGSLADIMLKIADIYDKKATETAEKLPIILEPMLLLFIGGLVGSIAFAIIIPIYSIVGTVGAT